VDTVLIFVRRTRLRATIPHENSAIGERTVSTKNREEVTKDVVLRLRMTARELRDARLAARADADGNVSEFVRRAMREKIDQLLAAA
jgi:hypothetical protein